MDIERPVNLIITGVGGQGTITAAKVAATAAVAAGRRVSLGETLGAAQRGGSVLSHVRLHGRRALGPLIPRGRADIILGLEPLETLRVLLDYGHAETKVIMNDRPLNPISCLSGEERYPDPARLEAAVAKLTPDLKIVPAADVALNLGHPAAANMVMLGALAAAEVLPFGPDRFLEGLRSVFDSKLLRLNEEAFRAGLTAADSRRG